MPALTILASAAQVGNRINTPLLQPERIGSTKTWRNANIETPIAIEHGGILAIQDKAFFMGDHHRDSRPIF